MGLTETCLIASPTKQQVITRYAQAGVLHQTLYNNDPKTKKLPQMQSVHQQQLNVSSRCAPFIRIFGHQTDVHLRPLRRQQCHEWFMTPLVTLNARWRRHCMHSWPSPFIQTDRTTSSSSLPKPFPPYSVSRKTRGSK